MHLHALVSDLTKKAWGIVCKQEDPFEAIRSFALILDRMASDQDDQDDAFAYMRCATEIRANFQRAEGLRWELFRMLHPRRAEFERDGSPSDQIEDVL